MRGAYIVYTLPNIGPYVWLEGYADPVMRCGSMFDALSIVLGLILGSQAGIYYILVCIWRDVNDRM